MEATCPAGHTINFDDPTDEGWEYSTREEIRVEGVTFGDGTTSQIERRVSVPVSRRIVVKCNEPTPTTEDPRKLCGTTFAITNSADGGDQ